MQKSYPLTYPQIFRTFQHENIAKYDLKILTFKHIYQLYNYNYYYKYIRLI